MIKGAVFSDDVEVTYPCIRVHIGDNTVAIWSDEDNFVVIVQGKETHF